MLGLLLALVSAAVLAGCLVAWFRGINAVDLDAGRSRLLTLIAVASVLALLALLRGAGTLGGILAGLSLATGVIWLGLRALSPQSSQPPGISVGDPLPDFGALDDSGHSFSSASLRGRPALLKFFRGHW